MQVSDKFEAGSSERGPIPEQKARKRKQFRLGGIGFCNFATEYATSCNI
jgi:hypothetical protein